VVTVLTLAGFGFLGQTLFRALGVTLQALQAAGGLALLLVALDMLRGQRSAVQETAEETAEGAGKDDVAITPLAIPMMAGPGAISAVILLEAQATTGSSVVCCWLASSRQGWQATWPWPWPHVVRIGSARSLKRSSPA